MSTYLSRPVFDFAVDWAQEPVKTLNYDLRERVIGFAPPVFEQLQSHTSAGWEFAVLLENEAAIVAFETFTSNVRGRLSGFWFPSRFAAMQIEPDVVSNVQFMIRGQNLAQWWQDHPSSHLAFWKPGETYRFGKILSVTAQTDGREVVVLESTLDVNLDETWDVSRLLYCRFADDEEEAQYLADNVQQRTVRVVELPTEYGQLETGQIPVFLFEFSQKLGNYTQYWRLTGLDTHILSNLELFSQLPIRLTGRRRSMRQEREEITIESWHDPALNPISQFIAFKVPTSLWVKVYETTLSTPDTRQTIFFGKVFSVQALGKMLEAKCVSWLDVAGRRFPKFLMQPMCNYFVYDQNCGVPKGWFTATGTIDALNGRRVMVNLSDPPIGGKPKSKDKNYFALGWVETGINQDYEIRSIRQNDVLTGGKMLLRLDRPLQHAIVNQQILLRAGCDGSGKMCQDRFGNFRRWGGHVMSPTNPAVEPLESEFSGGKK
jgi:hypothetical protein